jgi:hypothetical protein
MWECKAEYADSTTVCRYVPYQEGGNYYVEQATQYELECWLLTRHPDCTWYSVNYVEEA